ncbi:RsmB/NOP family class I SAM-dependent RNA methyltransferase [Stappia sp. ICDLI1TA098]
MTTSDRNSAKGRTGSKPPHRSGAPAGRGGTGKPRGPAERTQDRDRTPRRSDVTVEGLAARLAAIDILGRVIAGRRTLDEDLDETRGHAGYGALDARDRGLVRAILGAALRRRGQIAAMLTRLVAKPVPEKSGIVHDILHVAAAQILFLDVADRAAVDLAVRAAERDERARPYKGLVNAVLRRLSREREALLEATSEPWRTAPVWLYANWQRAHGEEAARAIALMHRHEPNLDLTVRSDIDGWAEKLGAVKLGPQTLRLFHGSGRVDQLAGYDEGAWWVQDAAASIPARLLGPVEGLEVADLCAAPGGKTAQLAAAGARVTAVDISQRRLRRLSENLKRLGLDARTVTSDLSVFEPAERFDAILLDAPCSATGTIRRHPEVAWTRGKEDVAALAERQAVLLQRASGWLKPGGRLVFCTCSLEPQEGEAVVDAFLAANPDFVRDPASAEETGIDGLEAAITPAGDLRTQPAQLSRPEAAEGGLDGFFAARLRRVPRNAPVTAP